MNGALPNTLLVQRLDAVLGVSLAKYSSLARAGGPFDALLEPGQTAPVDPAKARQERSAEPGARRSTRAPYADGLESAEAGKTRRAGGEATGSYPSSPTTLGQAARTVLGLLQSYPQTPQPPTLRLPLATAQLLQAQPSAGAAASPPGAGSSNSPNAASAAPGAPQQPLLSAGGSQPAIAVLAQALAARVQTSGMFYESHLARVAFEGQSPQGLREHPQALPPAQPGAAASATAAPAATSAAAAQLLGGADGAAPGGPAAGAAAGAAPATAPGGSNLLPDHALLVRQQLDVLASQQWIARAEAWPGVPMEWAIERAPRDPARRDDPADPGHRQGQDDPGQDGSQPWQTRLTLQLPHLGTVEAHVRIEGERCHLRLYSEQSPQALRQHAADLQGRFAASSVSLAELQISDALPRADGGGPPVPAVPFAAAPAP